MVLSLRLGQGINAMLLSKVFESFVGESPVTVMFRGMLENAWATEEVDLMFLRTAHKQYLRKILFSDLVDLMSLVVTCTKRARLGCLSKTQRDRTAGLGGVGAPSGEPFAGDGRGNRWRSACAFSRLSHADSGR
jgi:hypothetical protein